MQKKTISWLLAVSMVLSIFSFVPISATAIETELFYDDFESYFENSYPDSFTEQYNGTGSANQKIISTEVFDKSTGNVFQLEGAPSWASEQYVSLPALLPDNLIIDAYIKPVTSSRNAELALRNLSVGPWGTRISSVWFEGDGTIIAIQNGNDSDRVVIGDYTIGNWYRVTLDNDLTAKTYDVYINGVLASSDIPMNPTVTPTVLSLIAHNVSTSMAYFDQVGIYTQLPEFNNNVCKIGDSGYTSLANALDAVTSGQIITLLDDVEYNANIWVGSSYCPSFTLDLNGYSLTVSDTEVPLGALDGYSLSVTDNSTAGDGTLQLITSTNESAPTGLAAAGLNSRISIDSKVTASITATSNKVIITSAHFT